MEIILETEYETAMEYKIGNTISHFLLDIIGNRISYVLRLFHFFFSYHSPFQEV